VVDFLLVGEVLVMDDEGPAKAVGVLGVRVGVIPVRAGLVDLPLVRRIFANTGIAISELTVKLYVIDCPGGIAH